jgi:hypothetical protein
MEWLAYTGLSVGGYLAIAMAGYRIQYIKTYRRYLLWKKEAPKTKASIWEERGLHRRQTYYCRENVSYKGYFWRIGKSERDELEPKYLWVWPVVSVAFCVRRIRDFLEPEVTLPVSEAERLEILQKEVDSLDPLKQLEPEERHEI